MDIRNPLLGNLTRTLVSWFQNEAPLKPRGQAT